MFKLHKYIDKVVNDILLINNVVTRVKPLYTTLLFPNPQKWPLEKVIKKITKYINAYDKKQLNCLFDPNRDTKYCDEECLMSENDHDHRCNDDNIVVKCPWCHSFEHIYIDYIEIPIIEEHECLANCVSISFLNFDKIKFKSYTKNVYVFTIPFYFIKYIYTEDTRNLSFTNGIYNYESLANYLNEKYEASFNKCAQNCAVNYDHDETLYKKYNLQYNNKQTFEAYIDVLSYNIGMPLKEYCEGLDIYTGFKDLSLNISYVDEQGCLTGYKLIYHSRE